MKVYHQNVFERWPFEDESIQAIITSPPFYSLRKYDIPDIIIGGSPECEHEWIDSLDKWPNSSGGQNSEKQLSNKGSHFSEYKNRVTQSGFCIHCSAWQGQYGLEPTYQLYIEHTLLWTKEAWRVIREDGIMFLNLGDSYCGGQSPNDLPPKSKLLIPHRIAIGLIEQGWILRNDIVWSKPNAMPESVRDRFSKKFEYIFMLTKTGKYYFDMDAIRKELDISTIKRYEQGWNDDEERDYISGPQNHFKKFFASDELKNRAIERGKNPGDMWTFNTQPSPEKHYAIWPQKLVERMILCSTKPGDTVLDPFCGSGTTLRVADELNRVAYGIDLGYQDIQERRLSNIQKVLL